MSPAMIEAVNKIMNKPLPKDVANRLFILFNESLKKQVPVAQK